MHHCIVTVPAASAAAMLYARAAASSVRPGLYRLLALSPKLALLLVLPLAVPAYSTRGAAAFFLVWLGEFKLLLLSSGRGPLDPGLGPLPFVFTGALPVKLLHKRPDDVANKTEQAGALPVVYSSSVKLAAIVAIVYALRGKDRMHRYAAFTLYALITYCVLDSPLPRGHGQRAGHGAGADVRPTVPLRLTRGVLGPAVEPHGLGGAPRGRLSPRARSPRQCRRRRARRVPRVRDHARGHRVVHRVPRADGNGDRVLRAARRVRVRRAVVRGEAAAARGGRAARAGVRRQHRVLALVPAAVRGRDGRPLHCRDERAAVGRHGRRREAAPAPAGLVYKKDTDG